MSISVLSPFPFSHPSPIESDVLYSKSLVIAFLFVFVVVVVVILFPRTHNIVQKLNQGKISLLPITFSSLRDGRIRYKASDMRPRDLIFKPWKNYILVDLHERWILME